MRRFLLPLLLAVAVLVGLAGASAPAAHAAGSHLHYRRGYSIQGRWLCFGWSNGAFHCTTRHKGYRSLNPSWVPVIGKPSAKARAKARKPVHKLAVRRSAPVGHSPNSYPFGQCTWGAAHLAHDNVNHLGNAGMWYINAIRRGLPVGSIARVGATVVFAPGVQGASGIGHVGHVVKVLPGGFFLMEAMNDNAGWGRFGFRIAHQGWGVHFIY